MATPLSIQLSLSERYAQEEETELTKERLGNTHLAYSELLKISSDWLGFC